MRDVHTMHIAQSHNLMPQRTPRLSMMASNTLHEIFNSAQHSFSCSSTEKLSPTLDDTFLRCRVHNTCSLRSYKVEIAWITKYRVAHTGTEQYSTLSDPSIEAPALGTSHGIFFYRSCAFVSRRATLLLFKGLSIYIIYVQPLKISYQKFGSRIYTTKTLHI